MSLSIIFDFLSTALPPPFSDKVYWLMTQQKQRQKIANSSLSESHTSEKCGVINYAQKLWQKWGKICMLQEFNSVDYSTSLYGLYFCLCHDKWMGRDKLRV